MAEKRTWNNRPAAAVTVRNKQAISFGSFVEEKGGVIISEYTGSKSTVTIRCGHCNNVWTTTPRSILHGNGDKGTWCPACAKDGAPALDAQIVTDYIAANRGKLLSGEYVNNESRLTIECEKGHVFETCWRNMGRGRWCPRCAPNRELLLEDIREIAASHVFDGKQGEVLLKDGDRFDSAAVPLRCGCGHIWEAHVHQLSRGRWCPKCKYQRMWETRKNNLPRRKS